MPGMSQPPTPIAVDFAAGAFGGGLCIVLSQPLDVLRVRMQAASPGACDGAMVKARHLVQNEGVLALWRCAPHPTARGSLGADRAWESRSGNVRVLPHLHVLGEKACIPSLLRKPPSCYLAALAARLHRSQSTHRRAVVVVGVMEWRRQPSRRRPRHSGSTPQKS